MEIDRLKSDLLADWQPLLGSTAFRIEWRKAGQSVMVEHNADLPMEVGSCFKAFVAAECCRQVAAGAVAWDEPLLLTAADRVPSSDVFERIADGNVVTVRRATEAMLAVSDNTATDLLLRRLGV